MEGEANRCSNEDKGGVEKVSMGRCCNFLHCKISDLSFTAMLLQRIEKEEAAGEHSCNRSEKESQEASMAMRPWGRRVSKGIGFI